MHILLYTLSLAALLQAAPLSAPAPGHTPQQQTVKLPARGKSLFNGKNLAGWHADVPAMDKQDPAVKTPFIVRNGLLVSLGRPGGHLITDARYQNYRLEIEYRFAGKPGNCGVLVHASKPRALYAMFPQSIEVQMHYENAGDIWCICEAFPVPDMAGRRLRNDPSRDATGRPWAEDAGIRLGSDTFPPYRTTGFAWLRYRRFRLPAARDYPAGLVNSLATSFLDEALFRGILLALPGVVACSLCLT